MSRALFLDRDGTIIVHRPYLHRPEDVELIPGSAAALAAASNAGWRLFVLTNQSGVGRGWFSLADVAAVHQRMLYLLGTGSGLFTEICVAPEAPDQPANYRKPSPRFINEKISEFNLDPCHCWMIGDTPSDWHAGLAAKINAAAVVSDLTTAATEQERQSLGVPLYENLSAAIRVIIGNIETHSYER